MRLPIRRSEWGWQFGNSDTHYTYFSTGLVERLLSPAIPLIAALKCLGTGHDLQCGTCRCCGKNVP